MLDAHLGAEQEQARGAGANEPVWRGSGILEKIFSKKLLLVFTSVHSHDMISSSGITRKEKITMTDAYIIKDDYDQTTVTVVIGAENGEVAVELAKQQGF